MFAVSELDWNKSQLCQNHCKKQANGYVSPSITNSESAHIAQKTQCGWAHPEITPAPRKSLKYCKKQWVCKFYMVLPPTRRTPDGPMKCKEFIGKYQQNDVKHMVHFLFGNEVWLIKINQIEDYEWTEHIPETHNPLKNTTQTRYMEDDIMRQNWWNPCVYQQKVMLHKRSFAIFLRKCTVNPATDYNIFLAEPGQIYEGTWNY